MIRQFKLAWLVIVFFAFSLGIGPFANATEQDKTIAINEKAVGSEDRTTLIEVTNLLQTASRLNGEKKFAEAEAIYRRALAISEKAFGPEHPLVKGSMAGIVSALFGQGKFAEAMQLVRRLNPKLPAAFEDSKNSPDSKFPDTTSQLYQQASALLGQGKYVEAEKIYRDALAITEKSHGARHVLTAVSLRLLANELEAQGRYGECETLLRRELDLYESAAPGNTGTFNSGEWIRAGRLPGETLENRVAATLNQLASVLIDQRKYAEAESHLRRAFRTYEKAPDAEARDISANFLNLMVALRIQGKHSEADQLPRPQPKALDKRSIIDYSDIDAGLSRLAQLLETNRVGEMRSALDEFSVLTGRLLSENKISELEHLLRRGVAIFERFLGLESSYSLALSQSLALALGRQGKYAEAEVLYRRTLAIYEKKGPSSSLSQIYVPKVRGELAEMLEIEGRFTEAETLRGKKESKLQDVAQSPLYLNLASDEAKMLVKQRKYAEAEKGLRRGLELAKKTVGEGRPETASIRSEIALMQFRQGKYSDAEVGFRRALTVFEITQGKEHLATADSLNKLASVLEAQGRDSEAETLYMLAIDVYRKTHRRLLLYSAGNMGQFLNRRGKTQEALLFYREALDALDFLFAQTRGLTEDARQSFIGQYAHYYVEMMELLLKLHQQQPGAGYDREALAVTSRNQSRIFTELLRQGDVSKFSRDAKFITLKDTFDRLVEKLTSMRLERYTILASQDNAEAHKATLDAYITQAEKQFTEVQDTLRRDYPRFMELTQPNAVTVDQLQSALLRPEEVLISFALLPERAVVFAVTKQSFTMVIRPVRRDDISARVLAVRRGPDRVAAGDSIMALRQLDPSNLNFLYSELIAPIEEMLKGRSRVLVIGDGPLNTLPLEMLVTRYGITERQKFESARGAADGSVQHPWFSEYSVLSFLGVNYELAYLPSLGSLVSQRLHPKRATAYDLELISFADPIFSEETESTRSAKTRSALALLARGLRGAPGGEFTIPRLSETADEAREIATIVGGKHSLYLRGDAQEHMAKTADLSKTRYLHFATHGFLGGEFLEVKKAQLREGVELLKVSDPVMVEPARETAQPALALTLVGDLKGEDGLLTMSEIVENLDINAELVVLSACNTAGESEAANNGEGFAGLTRSFMYAGAKGLLVSHWSVESKSTQALIADTFRQLKSGMPTLSALNEARKKLFSTAYTIGEFNVSRSHPYFWAPFVFVGD